ncbi:hypothetical protein NFI95_10780, partial [Acetobacteraceae bacterium KSS8]|nr:hypothetical protein [Acetobacteraceae bacterium KSS8]
MKAGDPHGRLTLRDEMRSARATFMTPPHSFVRLDVRHIDGAFQASDRTGTPQPIRNGDEPVRALNFGWSPLWLIDLGLDVKLLELRFHDGHRATWFLDASLNRIGDQASALPEP